MFARAILQTDRLFRLAVACEIGGLEGFGLVCKRYWPVIFTAQIPSFTGEMGSSGAAKEAPRRAIKQNAVQSAGSEINPEDRRDQKRIARCRDARWLVVRIQDHTCFVSKVHDLEVPLKAEEHLVSHHRNFDAGTCIRSEGRVFREVRVSADCDRAIELRESDEKIGVEVCEAARDVLSVEVVLHENRKIIDSDRSLNWIEAGTFDDERVIACLKSELKGKTQIEEIREEEAEGRAA